MNDSEGCLINAALATACLMGVAMTALLVKILIWGPGSLPVVIKL
jgi:hypothetical protein